MKKIKVPGSGGVGSAQGGARLNKHLMSVHPDQERSHRTRDPGVVGMRHIHYPSMYDLARAVTKQK